MQIPRQVPHPSNNSPIDITNPWEIIIFIVIPIILLVIYFWSRKKGKRASTDQIDMDT